LYGQRLNVRFLHKLRDEEKFDGMAELKRQIAADMEAAKCW
ncbi:riboflavin kinase, partial [Neisseria meningitidis]